MQRAPDVQATTANSVAQVLVVRGSDHTHSLEANKAAATGPVASPVYDGIEDSLQVLESGVLQSHGIHSVGVAGPEGIPGVDSATLRRALKAKLEWADKADVDMNVVTQFCFSGPRRSRF